MIVIVADTVKNGLRWLRVEARSNALVMLKLKVEDGEVWANKLERVVVSYRLP